MRLSDKQLRQYMGTQRTVSYTEEGLQETIRNAKMAFVESEADDAISYAEFLYQQSRYIHKRWWILQGILLLSLWYVLHITESDFYVQRCMGIGASLFAVLLLPELWKNRNANALEIESASYFSLRQIYSARILAFAFVDLILLSVFVMPIFLTGKAEVEEMVIQFFLPYLVTCCICFRVLYSNRMGSEIFALFLCGVFCALWTQIVLNEKIYEAVSMTAWTAMTGIAFLYLCYCIYRGQNECKKIWEAGIYGIEDI